MSRHGFFFSEVRINEVPERVVSGKGTSNGMPAPTVASTSACEDSLLLTQGLTVNDQSLPLLKAPSFVNVGCGKPQCIFAGSGWSYRTSSRVSIRSEAGTVLGRSDEGFDHFSTAEVAPELVELVQPEMIAGRVGLAPEIAEVLHEDERRAELLAAELIVLRDLTQDFRTRHGRGVESGHESVALRRS